MSILSRIFGNPPTTPPALSDAQRANAAIQQRQDIQSGVQQQPAGNTQPTGNTTVPSDANNPNGGNAQNQPLALADRTGDKSPLDNYKDLWQPIDPAKSPPSPSLVPDLTLDPTKLMEAAKRVDFTQGLDPELVKKALGGDSASLLQVLNAAGATGLAQAANIASTITTQALTRQEATLRDHFVPDILRRERVNNAMNGEQMGKLMADPAAAPLLRVLTEQLSKANPNSPADAIRDKAMEYLTGFATATVAATGKQITDIPLPVKGARAPVDWDQWIEAK